MKLTNFPVQLFLAVASFAALGADAPAAQRATLGDSVVEPVWEESLTITVGPAGADIIGTGEKAIQAAVDYVARFGGGTVKILAGTYRMRNAVYLQSKVRLLGSGAETVLIKEPSVTTTLADDSDWFDQEITITDATGFEIGDGICLRTKDGGSGKSEVVKRTLVARTGNRFKLDQGLRKNFWRLGGATVSTLFRFSPARTSPTSSSKTSPSTATARRTRTSTATTRAAFFSRSATGSRSAASRRGITTGTG